MNLQDQLQRHIDQKTKPQGALGELEALALQIGLLQGRVGIEMRSPQIVVFAGDHGLTAEGVSAYPQAVTAQMVANMQAGGAAVNVLARQMGFGMTLVNAGVAHAIPAVPLATGVEYLDKSIAPGTASSLHGPAMSAAQLDAALAAGAEVVRSLPGNVVAFGEMGIGNTSAASLLLMLLEGVSADAATGRGTGLSDVQLAAKVQVLLRVAERHAQANSPLAALAAVGGFEIAMMVGAMRQAASERRLVLVDGFIASAAALVAVRLVPDARAAMVFAHQSAESGHQAMLAALGAQPLLSLGLRLGEGTGALLAWPLVQAAENFMREMASFESAGVAEKSPTGP